MSLRRAMWASQRFPGGSGLWRGGLWASQHTSAESATEQIRQLLFGQGQQGFLYYPKPMVDGVQVLWQDAAGTTPVTADGQVVGRMDDLSGNGNHAIQSSSLAKPLYRTDGTLHWLAPDKVDDRMTVGTAGDFNFLHDGIGGEWFFTAQPDAVSNPDTLIIFFITGTASTSNIGTHIGVDDRSAQSFNNAYRYVTNRGVNAQPTFSRFVADTVPDLLASYVFNGGHSNSRDPNFFANRDSTEVYSGDYVNAPSTADSTRPLTLFSRAENDFHFGGRFYGMALVDEVLDQNSREFTRSYFAGLKP